MSSSSVIRRLFAWSIVPLGVALLSVATLQPVSQAQPPSGGDAAPAEQQNGTTVLTRGPIHEAFGQPTVFNPKPGLLIPKKPPQPVEELPPDEKPEGDNVGWLGGYWSWDEEKSDFMWTSGFWRVLPPGRQWVPGYWNDNAGQFQWVSGYWAKMEQEEQEVIQQAPPESLERGAPPTAPSQEHIWAPGCWVYRDARYMWQPGYWIVNQPGWAWVPSCYNWTPAGYVYVNGYWDWSIRRRGILFAPCYFDPVVCYRPGFVYRPAVCLDIEVITPHFFCRPAYSHYYFGDYYATSYLNVGITPWFSVSVGSGHRFYSSDFAYYECHYRRSDPHWAVNVRIGYERCRDNVVYRPARTYVNQVTVINNININKQTNVNVNQMALGKPMKSYSAALAKNPDAPMKIEKINDARARDFGKTAADVRKVGIERSRLEKANIPGGIVPGKTGSTSASTTTKFTLPKSPIVSKVSSSSNVDTTAGSTKTPGIGSIGNQPSRLPPAIPGSSRINPSDSSGMSKVGGSGGSGAGTKSGGIIGSGAGSSTKGSDTVGGSTGSGAGTKGGGVVGSGSGSSTKGSGTVGGSSGSGAGSKSGGSGTPPPKGSGTVGGSSGSGSKSGGSTGGSSGTSKSGGSSSSGSSKSKEKDKDK